MQVVVRLSDGDTYKCQYFPCFNRYVVNLFQSGFQEDGEGRVNVDLSKHASAFLLQARETHRLTQVIYAIDFPINYI